MFSLYQVNQATAVMSGIDYINEAKRKYLFLFNWQSSNSVTWLTLIY